MPGPKPLLLALPFAAAVSLSGCGRSNNLLLGRVENTVGSHTVVVTDCYRTSVPPPERIEDPSGRKTFRFAPCRDAVVLIRGEELWVNGIFYGRLGSRDGVLVDHGVVSIERAGMAESN